MGYGIDPVSRCPNDARRLYHARRAQALSPPATIPRRAQPHHPCQLTVGRRGRTRRFLAPGGHGATMVTHMKRTQRKEAREGHHLYRRLGPIKSGTRRLRRRAQIHQPRRQDLHLRAFARLRQDHQHQILIILLHKFFHQDLKSSLYNPTIFGHCA